MEKKEFGIATKAWIIKDDKILIIYKTKLEASNTPNPSFRRDQPGGRVEFGENPQKALEREIKEEVDIHVQIIMPFDIWHFVEDDFQLVGIDYICKWISGNVHLSIEHENYEWITLNEIKLRKWHDLKKYEKVFSLYQKII